MDRKKWSGTEKMHRTEEKTVLEEAGGTKEKSGSVKAHKLKKGDFGYFEKNKRTQLGIAFVLLFFVAVVFYTGYIRYGDTKNIFTVMAVVSVIPMAKFLVAYIVLAPHRGVDGEMYRQIRDIEGMHFAYDLLLTSPEKIYEVRIAAIRDNSVYLYVEQEHCDTAAVEKYVRSFLEKECKVATVKAIGNPESYRAEVRKAAARQAGTYDKRIRELLLVYAL